MNQTIEKRLNTVGQHLGIPTLATYLFRIVATFIIGLWLSACNHHDEASPTQTPAEVRLAQKIDSIWTASMQNGTAPGMSVVVIKGGKLFFQKSYGYADLEAKLPVNNETHFAIGSTTKAMTAFGVLRLVDKGMVKLNEKVTTYIPDFVMKDMRYKEITVKQLLSHSSGIKTFTTLNPPDDSPGAIESIVAILNNEELAFAPGQSFYYSNYGTTLAGLLIQRMAKIPYETYIQRELFATTGMPNTTMEYWRPNALHGTKGYIFDSDQHRLIESPPYFNRVYNPAGAGTITTSNDIARYLTTVTNRYTTPGGEKLLSDSLVTQMFTGSVNAGNDDYVQYIGAKATYGFGWYNINRNGYVTIEHGGNIGSMLSDFLIDPKSKSAIGIAVNQEDFSKFAVAAEVAQLVFSAE
jgi:CubicO group peptidase (beta-lactamase class C family)